jgi:hypothetical protein
VQVLSWSLQTGIAYDDLNAPQRALVDRLIPEYRAQMQLGLTEKIMRDWETWGSRFPLVSHEVILAQMGEVGTYINVLMRARQDILNRNYRYDALWALFVSQRDAPAPVDQDKTPWSRIHQRIYMRFIAPRGANSNGVIQLRMLDGHSYHQQPSNTTVVNQAHPYYGANACALSDGLDCTQHTFDDVEGLTGPSLAQVAFPGAEWWLIPVTEAFPWGAVLLVVLGVIAIGVGTQALTATFIRSGEGRGGRRRPYYDTCAEHMAACQLTSLNDLRGRVYGENRCLTCAGICEADEKKEWPRTRTWAGRCDYWNFPSQ